MGFSFHSTCCVKRAEECWNENHTINGSARAAKTKEKPAGVNRRAEASEKVSIVRHMRNPTKL